MSQWARNYTVLDGHLYKSGVVAPWLKCITIKEGKEILQEIHSESCGSHIGVRPLVSKAFRQGFFWPSSLKDAEQLVKTCKGCQMMGPNYRRPLTLSQLIPPAWPLQRWGMDLVGPLPTAQGNLKYAVVAVEYFTKWVEAKPLINITSEAVRKFFWQNIICGFGVPRELTVDNSKQFDSQHFKEFCHSVRTKLLFASVCGGKSKWRNLHSHQKVLVRSEKRKMDR